MGNETKVRRILEGLADAVSVETTQRERLIDFNIRLFHKGEITDEQMRTNIAARNADYVERENQAVHNALVKIVLLMDGIQTEGIRVEGHRGTWHVIDRKKYNGQALLLLEHDTYGEDVASVIVTEKTHKLKLDDVWNGWLDYEEAFCD